MIAVTTAPLTVSAKAFCAAPVGPLFSQVPCATQVAYQRPTAGMAVGFLVVVVIAVGWVSGTFGRGGGE